MPQAQTVALLEFVASPSRLSVDREAGVIHDVKVLGQRSANGRRYLPEAIEQAKALYEGRQVNANHPAKPGDARSAYDRFGWLEGCYTKDGELYAKRFHYLKTHPLAGPVTEAAERNPALFGLSHNAVGRERAGKGEPVIEAIAKVNSVDLVADPATTHGLFEGVMQTKPLKEIKDSLAAGTPARRLLEEMDAAGMGEMPLPAASASSPEEALKSGFKAAIHAIVDDDSLDVAGKVQKIKELLKMQEKAMGKGEEKPAEKPEEKPATESRQDPTDPALTALQEQLATLQRREKARELCDAEGIVPTKVLRKALDGAKDEAEMKGLIEEFKGDVGKNGATKPAPQKPRSAAPGTPLVESRNGKLPETAGELAAYLRN